MVRKLTTFHLSITVDGHQVSERPNSDGKRKRATGLQGPEASCVLKGLLAAKPREPVSLILHQSGDTLVGVASEDSCPSVMKKQGTSTMLIAMRGTCRAAKPDRCQG